ncbi:hypothetical protein [Bartonella massiliensis]|nr:hypothetical protein [Bartonella massiliensis]
MEVKIAKAKRTKNGFSSTVLQTQGMARNTQRQVCDGAGVLLYKPIHQA